MAVLPNGNHMEPVEEENWWWTGWLRFT